MVSYPAEEMIVLQFILAVYSYIRQSPLWDAAIGK